MKQSRIQRLSGALLALCMLVQPAVPFVMADVPSTEAKPVSASSSKEATWAGVLQEVDGQLPKFQEYLRGRQQLYKEMRTCIDLWANILEEKGPQSQQPKLLAVAKEYGKRFAETLTNADDFTTRFSQDLGSVGGTGGQFILDSPDGSHKLALLYESQARVGLLNGLDATIESLWDGFVASQILPLRPDQLEKGQLQQVLDAQASVAAKIQEGRKSNEDWRAAWAKLERQENPEAQTVDFPKEAKLLKAATRLSDDAYTALREKTDPTAKAHVQMLERYRTVLLQKSEELQELTGQRDPQLLSESFLQLADPAKLDGDWLTFAERQKEIASELVKGLSAKAAAFDKAVSSAKVLAAEAGKTAESLRGKSTGHESLDQALQKELAGAEKNIQVASESLRTLDKARKKFNDALSAIGVLQGATARLGDPRVAMYCDDLGRTYDLGEVVLLQISQQSGAITHAAGVYRVSGATVLKDSLTNANGAFYAAFDGFSKVIAADQPILERHRQLSIEVLAKYNATVSSASKQFKEVADGSGQSSYLPVLCQMSALLEKGADRVNGLVSPMLQAVAGPNPAITAPRLSWRGTSTLGNAVTRLIEQGSYFERGAIDDAKALAKDGAGQSFSDSLRVVDLAMALHYPIRTLVAPDGMALVLGVNGPGVVIRGIGNVEHFKLKDGTALLSPPDFTVGGYAIGWDFGGAFQNFCSDVGSAVTGAEQTMNNVAQGAEQFGAQVVNDAGQDVGNVVKGAEEVGSDVVAGAENVGSELWPWSPNFNVWKVVEYAGYGVAIVASGGLATPLVVGAVAVAVASDVGQSAVKVAKDQGQIDEQTDKWGEFAFGIVHTVAGGLAGLSAVTAATETAPLWATLLGGDSIITGIGGAVLNDVANFETQEDHNPGDQQGIQVTETLGNVFDLLSVSGVLVGDVGTLNVISYLSYVDDGLDVANFVKTVYDDIVPPPPSLLPSTPSGNSSQGNGVQNNTGNSVGQPGNTTPNGAQRIDQQYGQ